MDTWMYVRYFGDIVEVQIAGITPPERFSCADFQAAPPGPIEYLSSVVGPTRGEYLNSVQLGYQANQMPSPKGTQRTLPTGILRQILTIGLVP